MDRRSDRFVWLVVEVLASILLPLHCYPCLFLTLSLMVFGVGTCFVIAPSNLMSDFNRLTMLSRSCVDLGAQVHLMTMSYPPPHSIACREAGEEGREGRPTHTELIITIPAREKNCEIFPADLIEQNT